MPPAKESSALLRTPVSLAAVNDKPSADLVGLHKEVRLEPTISFNSKWFVQRNSADAQCLAQLR